jgi:hypothetical protein
MPLHALSATLQDSPRRFSRPLRSAPAASKIITIGKRLVPVNQLAFVEPFDPGRIVTHNGLPNLRCPRDIYDLSE